MSNVTRRTLLQGAAAGAALAALPHSAARAQGAPIRIGLIGPLSGAMQPVGSPVLIGGEIAAAQINAAGGILGRKVELVVRDDKGDPTQSVAAIRDLVGNGVNMIVGVPLTATALAAAGIIESVNGIYISTGTQEEKLTHELFTRHYFQGNENGITRARAMAQVLARRHPDVTRWTAIIPDVSIGHGSWNRMSIGLKDYYKSVAGKDITIMDPVVAKYGSTDFKNQIVALMSSPATGLHNVLFGSDGITFFQQAAQFGMPKKFAVISEQALDVDLPKALKGNMPDNVWSASYWYHAAFDNPESAALAKAFTEKTGDPNPHAFAALSHLGVKAYAAAIQANGGRTDTAAVIDALETVKFLSAKGPTSFRKEDHQIVTSSSAFHAVASSSKAGWEVKDFAAMDLADISNPPAPRSTFKI